MRALHLFPVYPGEPDEGSAAYSRALTRELARRGVEIEVLASRAVRPVHRGTLQIEWPNQLQEAESVDGLPVERLTASNRTAAWMSRVLRRLGSEAAIEIGRGPWSPGMRRRLARRAGEVDLLLAGHAPFWLLRVAVEAGRSAGSPVVLLPFLHEEDPFHRSPRLDAAYHAADAVLVLSPHTEALLREQLSGSNPVTVGAGVDLELFDSPEVDGMRFRERHGLGQGPVALFVGRKEPGKRYDLALRALAGMPEKTSLVMVGRDIDGASLPGGVIHIEQATHAELADAYDACDLLLHPSEQESFGMVAIEAWTRRRPVLANARCGASAALVRDGIDGLLLEPEADWGAAAARLLADPDRRRSMGEAGRQRVLAEFTWPQVGERVHRLYEELTRAG